MTTKYLMNANRSDPEITLGRRRTLRLLAGMPLLFGAISVAGCADVDVRPANAPKPKSYITADPY